MKKLRIILITSAICLFIFSNQKNIFAMLASEPFCLVIEAEIKGHDLADEGTVPCEYCIITGDPVPVYNQQGDLIGHLYGRDKAIADISYAQCEAIYDTASICYSKTAITGSGECDTIYVPDTTNYAMVF